MRDPIMTSKFNRLQLFCVRPLLYQVSPEAGFRNRDVKAFPPEHL